MRVARLAKKKRKKKARRSGGAFIEQRARVYSISRTDDGRGHHRRRPQHISNFVLTTLSLRVSRRVPCVSRPTEAKHHHHHHHHHQHRRRRRRVTTNHHGWRRRAREAHEGKTRPSNFFVLKPIGFSSFLSSRGETQTFFTTVRRTFQGKKKY